MLKSCGHYTHLVFFFFFVTDTHLVLRVVVDYAGEENEEGDSGERGDLIQKVDA